MAAGERQMAAAGEKWIAAGEMAADEMTGGEK
jgi:hypothetical protein